MIKKRFRLTAATLAAVVGLVLLPAMPAVGQSSPPQQRADIVVLRRAVLEADGAAVRVNTFVTCASRAQVSVEVAQVVRGFIERGFGFDDVNCSGGIDRVRVLAVAQVRPFRVGEAVAQVSLFEIEPPFGFATATEVVRVRNRGGGGGAVRGEVGTAPDPASL